MHVVVFEGMRWTTFAPLSFSRPIFSLISGCGTLLDRQLRGLTPTRLTLWVRPEMVNYCRRHVLPKLPVPAQINTPLDGGPALIVSGRSLGAANVPPGADPFVALDDKGICVAYTPSAPGLSPKDSLQRTDAWLALHELPNAQTKGHRASYLWDLIAENQQAIISDVSNNRSLGKSPRPLSAGPYHVVRDEDVWLGQDVQLGPGCVLDASKGPVVLGDGVVVGPNAVLQGPCCIGQDTQITALSFIRPGTSTGPRCKIGGEISNSIFVGNSNKPHDGFLGDSYLGEWVNLGAGTMTSNLKNTYGPIDVAVSAGKPTPTGRQFLGSLIGDHTKVAIGTRLMTGSYIGYCAMIATSALPPTRVPSFTFLTDKGAVPYQREKAKDVMRAVFKRRGREWEPLDEELMEYAALSSAQVEG